MQTYKIKTKHKEYQLKTSNPLSLVKTSPALFFLTDGEYKIEKCGQLNALKQLNSHVKSLINSWSLNNG